MRYLFILVFVVFNLVLKLLITLLDWKGSLYPLSNFIVIPDPGFIFESIEV